MKLASFREKLKEQGIDAALIYSELNQQYLSDFRFTDGFLMITASDAYLITDFRYYEMALNSANKEFQVLMPDSRTDFINDTLKRAGCKNIGFEGNVLSYLQYMKLKDNHPSFNLIDMKNTIEILREVKSEEEISWIAKAQKITDNAFSHLLKMITPQMTEIEVAAELEYAMRRLGADGFAFDTIAVSGDASALPHGTPRNLKLKKGFLTMDFGAKYNGYCSDMTRTIVIGTADKEIKKLYNTVLLAQSEALAYLKAGASCSTADKIARDIIDKEYNGCFGHSLGHSVGLFIHESPSLSKAAGERVLRKNEILTVEPGIYILGKYGCRIEDMVAIKENGIFNFTKSTKELIEIV